VTPNAAAIDTAFCPHVYRCSVYGHVFRRDETSVAGRALKIATLEFIGWAGERPIMSVTRGRCGWLQQSCDQRCAKRQPSEGQGSVSKFKAGVPCICATSKRLLVLDGPQSHQSPTQLTAATNHSPSAGVPLLGFNLTVALRSF
jgi:hypothetical protein